MKILTVWYTNTHGGGTVFNIPLSETKGLRVETNDAHTEMHLFIELSNGFNRMFLLESGFPYETYSFKVS